VVSTEIRTPDAVADAYLARPACERHFAALFDLLEASS
jgi:hypothetical protein